MWVEAGRRLSLERDLDAAVNEKQFLCHYQPIVDLETGRLKGTEALVRWQHPSGKLLAPADFIEIAEKSGTIHEIEDQVLSQATSTMAGWRERFPDHRDVFISVNVSPRQFQDPGFVERVAATLQGSGLLPQALVLEITEGAMMREQEHTVLVLRELRNLGVRIAIDDFGTGYSSLNYLRFLPVDMLKIDRSFVSASGRDDAIVDTIARLAATLNIVAVAEGIEQPEPWRRLRAMGCQLGQGFLIARPARAEEAGSHFEADREAGEVKVRRARRGRIGSSAG
jgi:EAL domain-containing protein (putative c-di-GMP-specific phosphodiesterase class I)